MTIGTKVLVVLAFVVAAFYLLEVALTVASQGFVVPVFVKAAIAVAALYYAISKIRKSNSTKEETETQGA